MSLKGGKVLWTFGALGLPEWNILAAICKIADVK